MLSCVAWVRDCLVLIESSHKSFMDAGGNIHCGVGILVDNYLVKVYCK